MKKISFVLSLFIFVSLRIYAQEPEVKILATPEMKKDEVILKNGTHIIKRIIRYKEGEYVRIARKTYKWDEIASINLSKFTLQRVSPNWGEKLPVYYDSTLVKDKVVMNDGTTVEGTIFDFVQFYKIRTEVKPFTYINSLWKNIKEVYLAKGSPFTAFCDAPNVTPDTTTPTNPLSDTKITVKKDIVKLGYKETLSTDQIRKAWQIRGGPIFSQEFNGSITIMKADGLSGTGFGYGGGINLVNLTPPSYTEGVSKLSAYKVGANFNFQSLVVKMKDVDNANITLSNFTFGLNFAYQMGFGKFLDNKNWKGAVVGFAWRPTFQMSTMTMTIGGYSDSQHDSNFNMASYEFYFDFANLQAITSRFVKPAHMKIFAIVIPPVGKMQMTFVQIGFGMVSY